LRQANAGCIMNKTEGVSEEERKSAY